MQITLAGLNTALSQQYENLVKTKQGDLSKYVGIVNSGSYQLTDKNIFVSVDMKKAQKLPTPREINFFAPSYVTKEEDTPSSYVYVAVVKIKPNNAQNAAVSQVVDVVTNYFKQICIRWTEKVEGSEKVVFQSFHFDRVTINDVPFILNA